MTPKYQNNHFYQRELKYAADQHKPSILIQHLAINVKLDFIIYLEKIKT